MGDGWVTGSRGQTDVPNDSVWGERSRGTAKDSLPRVCRATLVRHSAAKEMVYDGV
jgi:hypothetical protein